MSNTSKSYTQIALQRFKKDFWGVLCFWVIIAISAIALFAYFLIPDNSKNANAGDLALRSQAPGFTVNAITIPSNADRTWSELWFGKEEATKFIPVSEYKIENDTIHYKNYSNQPRLEDVKKIALSQFGNTKESDIIKEKKYR